MAVAVDVIDPVFVAALVNRNDTVAVDVAVDVDVIDPVIVAALVNRNDTVAVDVDVTAPVIVAARYGPGT